MATDGLWDVVSLQEAVDFIVHFRKDEMVTLREDERHDSKVADVLVQEARHRWTRKGRRADNITVLIVYFFEMDDQTACTPTGGKTPRKGYFRPNAVHVALCESTKLHTMRVAIMPKDLQLGRRISGKTDTSAL